MGVACVCAVGGLFGITVISSHSDWAARNSARPQLLVLSTKAGKQKEAGAESSQKANDGDGSRTSGPKECHTRTHTCGVVWALAFRPFSSCICSITFRGRGFQVVAGQAGSVSPSGLKASIHPIICT